MSKWKSIDRDALNGIILLLVKEESSDERRVFVAEASIDEHGVHWITTVGWCGWSKLHKGWTPIAWQTLPEPE